jgi:hypothetical protein
MGFDRSAQAVTTAGETPLWRQYWNEFPVTRNLIYLNHAAVAPLSRRAADAMKRLADDACDYGWMLTGA